MLPFFCLECTAPLNIPHQYSCSECGRSYRLLENIPLLVRDEAGYIADMINTYFQFLLLKSNEIEKLKNDFKYINSRSNLLERLTEALNENNKVIEVFIKKLEKEDIPLIQILKANRPIGNISHFKDFTYLKRDWCWLAEGEKQLSIITSCLLKIIDGHFGELDNALFLGSGVGRIALELMDRFDKVYATDLSFSMMYFFNELLQGNELTFYEINYSNTLSDEFVTRKLTASADRFKRQQDLVNFQKLNYFISDVTGLPFLDESLASVFSVYFTDVIALKLFLSEVVRVLKPGGLFVHFGPLGYGFENVAEKLSANEVKERFRSSGFDIIYEDIIPASHMESDYVMDAIQLKNWVFVARKHKVGHPTLKTTDLLKLAPGINYQINGTLFSQADQSRNTTVWTAEGLCYALNEISADIISEVSANALSADQLISVLKESYVIDDSAVLTDILKDLISKRILDFN